MLDNDLRLVKAAQKKLALLDEEKRNECLKKISDALLKNKDVILAANQADVLTAKQNGIMDSFIDRLTLNEKRIDDLSKSILELINLDGVVGNIIEKTKRPNGLVIEKIYVPFGVIAVIFEARPNVCVDIATLCLKTANACVLKGGKESINTNKVLVSIMKDAIKDIIDPNVLYLVDKTDRAITDELITKRGLIDLLIPRGSARLINYVVSNAKIPYIETGAGVCNLYVHEKANIDMAINIAVNAKYQRPSVCNSIENLVVDEKIANDFLPKLYEKFNELNIKMLGDEKTLEIINVGVATEEDFYTEYNDYIISIKIVKDLDEAIDFINEHSTKHSEAIVTDDIIAKERFLNEIESACVYHNASTRFSDGGCFGFGAEVGISTQKLHARGPMGLKEICSYKYIIKGDGQVR